jgi:hypothetical protein
MSSMSELAIEIEELLEDNKSDEKIIETMVSQMGVPVDKAESWLKAVKKLSQGVDK